jgi:hypothetical protein
MPENFFDTCALQHRYVDGDQSERVRRLLRKRDCQSHIADTTMLEMPSALAQQCRRNQWDIKRFDHMHAKFLNDVAGSTFSVRPSSMREAKRAIHLLRFAGLVKKRNLRSADALIATIALEYAHEKQEPINFFTSDWTLFFCLRDLNAFRTTMNLFLLGATKDGSSPICKVLLRK